MEDLKIISTYIKIVNYVISTQLPAEMLKYPIVCIIFAYTANDIKVL